ncbi:M23 family metallopeptidase [Novosphingobium sp. MW5]|nr:M23 family metallopeptidase [Novosphingobium sp. MW5]
MPPKPELQSARLAADDQIASNLNGPARSAPAVPLVYAMPPMPRLEIPVQGVQARQMSDTFTQSRDGGARRHDAIDIIAPSGTPVLAAADGEVERLFLSRAGGNTIYVRSPDRRVIYYYAHLESYAPGLAEKQRVRAGQVIGAVGVSGNADPAVPHLHFAIMVTTPEAKWWNAAMAVNPYPLLTRR